jgi:hypothetical protein
VLACLRRAKLANVEQSFPYLWAAYDYGVGGFVYVQLYKTAAAAAAEARFLSDEEVVATGSYLVSQHIAPYPGSPVPAIVACVSGRPFKGRPVRHHRERFVF